MSSVTEVEMIANATGRKFTLAYTASSSEDFEAVENARNWARHQGYNIGSMCRDEPIACSLNVKHIAKWYNISIDEWPQIGAVLVSKNFRYGPISVYTFQ